MNKNLIRERANKYGINTLLNWEVVSLLTNIKVEVLEQYKGFDELYNKIELLEVTALQKQKIRALFEASFRINSKTDGKKVKISSPRDIFDWMSPQMKYLKKEEFRIALLNTKNVVIDIKTISVGSLNASIVHPREVLKEAIITSSASVVLIHNHPSGNSRPSKEDISITKRLAEAGELVGINILDHVIIGNDYTSLKEEGIL
jgi:DNA repair protein RadC